MKLFNLLLASLMVSMFSYSQAYASSGTVLVAKGVVSAKGANNKDRVLSKGASVEEGDIISTASKSFAVIRMLDNSKLTLKPGTTIAIGKFSLDKGKEEACINLVKGGLRTVTGLIGKRRPDAFQVDTPIASIGIRGTDFITRICAGDECSAEEPDPFGGDFNSDDQQDKVDVVESINSFLPEGMYGSCETGAIVMSQCAGQSSGFELGKCRISQRKDCSEVALSPGQAGYTGVPPVEVSSSDATVQPKTAADQADKRSGASRLSSNGSITARGDRSVNNPQRRSGNNLVNGSSNANTDAEIAQSTEASSDSNSGSRLVSQTGSQVESKSGLVGRGSQPVVLVKPPVAISQDPYFRLSDLSDGELDALGDFPNTLSPTGQCTI